MKIYSTTLALVMVVSCTFAQNGHTELMLVRHDTTILMTSESEWIVRSLAKNDPALTSEIGKSVPEIIFQAIGKGKVIAIDPQTNKPIPAKEIYTYQMATDTMATYDALGNMKYEIIQKQRDPDRISRIRVFQDWYFDIATGKLDSHIKWIELMEEIHTPYSGDFLGYQCLCRIFY